MRLLRRLLHAPIDQGYYRQLLYGPGHAIAFSGLEDWQTVSWPWPSPWGYEKRAEVLANEFYIRLHRRRRNREHPEFAQLEEALDKLHEYTFFRGAP